MSDCLGRQQDEFQTHYSVYNTFAFMPTQVLFANGTVSQFVRNSPLIPEDKSCSQSQRAESAKSDRDSPKKGEASSALIHVVKPEP